MDIETSLQVLIDDWTTMEVGEIVYAEICAIVKAVIIGGNYPPIYSPTGVWDEHAFCSLANDFIVEKLLKGGYLAYLLHTNTTIRAFRRGVDYAFKNFLISKKKRTSLDNLFRRAYDILNRDGRFRCFVPTTKKARSLWGLSAWDSREIFSGREEELVRIGFSSGRIRMVEYRLDAKKMSHIVSNKELSDYMYSLFMAVDSLLSLEHLLIVFKYRFNLLEIKEVSLEEPALVDDDGSIITIGETVGTSEPVTAVMEIEEAAAEVLRSLTPRQKQILIEFQEPEPTLSSIGERVGCSKSTVDNELKRIHSVLAEVADDDEQAHIVFRRMVDIIERENE